MGEQSDVDQIKRSLQEIKAALLGDEYHPDGLLKRVYKLEAKVDRTDKKILVYVSIVSGFISAIGFLIKKIF